MSASIRISRKTARFLLDCYERWPIGNNGVGQELRAALQPKPKSSLRKKTEKRKRTKGAETKAIRAEVVKRAGGQCENCNANDSQGLELDHFWGRGKAKQSVSNCWLLCRPCHRAKTNNIGTAPFWFRRFGEIATRHGYAQEAIRAYAKYDAERLLLAAEAVGTP